METFSALLAICAGNSPRTKPSDAEFWCFLCDAPEWTVEETIVRLVIWDTIVCDITVIMWRFDAVSHANMNEVLFK